jgi:hypothetical protein
MQRCFLSLPLFLLFFLALLQPRRSPKSGAAPPNCSFPFFACVQRCLTASRPSGPTSGPAVCSASLSPAVADRWGPPVIPHLWSPQRRTRARVRAARRTRARVRAARRAAFCLAPVRRCAPLGLYKPHRHLRFASFTKP